jgi:hypothetical protein
MKVELNEHELSLVISALVIAKIETGNDDYDIIADELRIRRHIAKSIETKGVDWTGLDL